MIERSVPYVDLGGQFAAERATVMAAIERVMASGMLVGGDAIAQLEAKVAKRCGTAHAVAVNSGTDALILGLRAMGIGPGDEVITPPNSFVASTGAIVAVGATPVFADVLDDQNVDPRAVEAAITPRTKSIMPVHLTGRICEMDAILDIAQKRGIDVIEDAAQAFGSTYHGRSAGSFGRVGCLSAHPLKNFNAAGDGGFLVTDDAGVADRVRLYRNHGLADRNTVTTWGTVSRMDTIQAAVLLARLDGFNAVVTRRRAIAAHYRARLDSNRIYVPQERPDTFDTHHTFVVQLDRRGALQASLAGRGIGTAIHYPIPIHLQPAAESLGHGRGSYPTTERQADRILSLPIHQMLSDDDVDYVCDAIREFYS